MTWKFFPSYTNACGAFGRDGVKVNAVSFIYYQATDGIYAMPLSEESAMRDALSTSRVELQGWRCFWCNEVFTEFALAEMHFGSPHSGKPAPECSEIKRRFVETARMRLAQGRGLTSEEINDLCNLARGATRSESAGTAGKNHGPAKVFRAIAERIEAGEEYHSVLADYDLKQGRDASTRPGRPVDAHAPASAAPVLPSAEGVRPATHAENLRTIVSRLSDHLSAAEVNELYAAAAALESAPSASVGTGLTAHEASVIAAAVQLAPLLEQGWDDQDTPEDQNEGAKACDALVDAVNAMLATSDSRRTPE